MAERPTLLSFLICILLFFSRDVREWANISECREAFTCTRTSLQTRAPSGLYEVGVFAYIRPIPTSLRPRIFRTKHRTSHLRPSKREAIAQRAEWSTTDKGPRGLYDNWFRSTRLPSGEILTHCVGGAVKFDHNVQCVATSRGGAAWSQRRQLTLEDMSKNAKELVCEESTG